MNKMKTKLLMVCFASFLLIPLIMGTNAATTLVEGDRVITDINVIIKGYDGVDQSSSLSQTYNATIPVIGLHADVFTEESQAPDDFQTDGITRTYSDSIWSTITTPSSIRGMWSTLRSMCESTFSQLTVERDVAVVTYTPAESYYTTVNDTMYAENPSWTAENFTVSEMYALLTFDRAVIDAFFTAAMAEDGYGLVTQDESTNTQLIENLLDNLFTEYCLDLIYSPVNISTSLYYSSVWTVPEEVRAVLGGNSTDLSVNATIKNVSIRNAVFGYLGEKIVGDTVVGAGAAINYPEGPEDILYGFSATPTTYSIKFNVRGDYASSPLGADLISLFTFLTEAEVEQIIQRLRILWLENVLITLAVAAGLGLIAYFAMKKKKHPNSTLVSLVVFGLGFAITLVIIMLATIRV